MTDKELLQLAAKAAGMVYLTNGETCHPIDGNFNWNPLTNDGDALRLAVQLFFFVDSAAGAPDSFGAEMVRAGSEVVDATEPRGHEDPYAATRRAITRAAAEIGKVMP